MKRNPYLNYTRLPMENAYNVRELGGYATKKGSVTIHHQFLRSENLTDITEEDKMFLIEYGLSGIIDLRSREEALIYPNPFRGNNAVKYINCPLITDENHQKLSKRCGHSSYEDLVDQGFLTEAIVNFVALLGWSPVGNEEIFSLDELIKVFDYHHISKSPAVFDYTKLKWMNGEYIKAMDFDKFYERAEKYVRDVITKDYDLKKIAHMVQTRIEIFPDIRDHIDFFEELPEYDVAMYTHKKMKTNAQTSLEVLQEILPVLEVQEDYSNDALYQTLLKYVEQKGCKNGYVMWPIRTAVSGKQMTPGGATELMEVLGKEESLARIRKGIELLSQAQ